jgi:hypothetical protein
LVGKYMIGRPFSYIISASPRTQRTMMLGWMKSLVSTLRTRTKTLDSGVLNQASRPAVVLEMESRVLKHIEDVGGKPYTTDQVEDAP